MSDGGVVQIQAFGGFCFEADAIGGDAEQLGDTGADRRGVRSDLRSGEDEAGVEVSDGVAGIVHASQGFAQEDDRIRAFPSGVRRREKRADVGRGHGTEQRVGDGVQQDVAVGVAA